LPRSTKDSLPRWLRVRLSPDYPQFSQFRRDPPKLADITEARLSKQTNLAGKSRSPKGTR
jgi:hypothetical protein